MSTKPSTAAIERRRKPELVRHEALAAGRRLLVEGGPRAVTLKAVGGELGMTHANLIHHFGSAEAFQTQLKDLMVNELTREITAIVAGAGSAAHDTASIVAKVFDAYGRGGIAVLMAWSMVTGPPHDDGLTTTTRELVDALAPHIAGPDRVERAREIVTLVTLVAFADGLIGDSLARAVGAGRDAVRGSTARLVEGLTGRSRDE